MSTSYTTLVASKATAGSLKYILNYEKIDPETALDDAQSYIYGALRAREMRMSAPVAIADGASTAPLPARFLEPLKLLLPNGLEIQPKEMAEFLTLRAIEDEAGTLAEGQPTLYAIYNEVLNFDFASDAAYTATLAYYGRPADLSVSGTTNFLTDRYSGLLRAACRMAAFEQMEDTGEAQKWQTRTDQLIARANGEADLSLRGVVYGTNGR